MLFILALAQPQGGVQRYDEGDFEGAVSLLREVSAQAEAGPERARALLYLGLSHAALQQDDDARAAFRRALEDEPDLAPDRRRVPPAVLEMFDAVRAALHARLEVATEPGATVRLDGRPLGSTPYAGEVPIGRHEVEIRTPDRLRELPAAELRLRPGSVARLEGPLVLRQGLLTLTSVPPGAAIHTEDGRTLGSTPLVELRLPAGRLRVRAELPPRPTLYSELLVDPDVPARVELTLPPTPWYARASSWGWVAGAAAAGLSAGGVVLGLRAQSDAGAIDTRARAGELNYDEWRRLRGSAMDSADAANLLFASAALAALTCGALFVFGEE